MARTKATKFISSLPEQYLGDFEACLDPTSDIGAAVTQLCTQLAIDLGGEDQLSTVTKSVVRDFAALHILVGGELCRMAARQPIDIGGLTQLINSKLGLGRVLGLQRRPKPIGRLDTTRYKPPAASEAAA